MPGSIPPHLRPSGSKTADAPKASTTPARDPHVMNAGLGAKSIKSEHPFPCTYRACTLGFSTFRHLRRHKKDQHDYCKECNLDFEDDEALIQHRIESTLAESGMHISCLVCGDDFGCEAGRNAHMKLSHALVQEIICPGCEEIFEKGAAFLAHIWHNSCKRHRGLVTSDVMSKARIAAAIELQKRLNEAEGSEENPAGESVTDAAGGVRLPQSVIDGQASGLDYDEEFPAIGMAKMSINEPDKGKSIESRSQPKRDWAGYGSAAGMDDAASTAPTYTSRGIIATDWDAYLFDRDVSGSYLCPFDQCSFQSHDKISLKAHLISGYHIGTDHRCVKCLKLFKTPIALMAHMESSSTRCPVRDSKDYAHVVYVISGSFLDVCSDERGEFLDDGQIRLVAPTHAELEQQVAEMDAKERERLLSRGVHPVQQSTARTPVVKP